MELLSGDCKPPAELIQLTGPVMRTVDEGVRLAVEYYDSNGVPAEVTEARKCMAGAMKYFHSRAGILDEAVEAELALMTDPAALVVEVAHQPNIFPYSGFYKKIVLGKVLYERLKEKVDAPVVLTFGFHDQDLANPKWFRTTQLPDLFSQNGVLTLKLPVSRKSQLAMYRLPELENAQVEAWKTVLENWLTNNIRRFNKLVKTHHDMFGYDEEFMLDRDRTNVIRGRMRRVYELMDESHRLASGTAEFNAFFTAKLVHEHWEYPMLFYDYHSIAGCAAPEYAKLLSSKELLERYSRSFSAAFRLAGEHDIGFDFKLPDADQAPFWYQCTCGGKVEVAFNQYRPEFDVEACPECGKAVPERLHEFSAADVDERFSPRAAYRPLLIANTLMPSIFVSGLAAQGFHMISRGIAEELDVPLSPFIIWPGGDEYRSLPKMVAEMTMAELKKKPEPERTMKERKIMENYPNTMTTIPSIIDHLVNIGQKEVSEAWEEHLSANEILNAIPKLNTIFDS